MKRRAFLLWSMATILWLPFKSLATAWNKAAFDAVKGDDAMQQLHMDAVSPTADIEINLPPRAENGAIVQLAVNCHIAETESIAVFVAHNPTALIANISFYNGALPQFITRIKMAETSPVQVVAQAKQHYFSAVKTVEVLENGCGGSDSNVVSFESSMKMRAKLLPAPNPDNQVEVKAIITHPMQTGYAKDAEGRVVPAFFMQLVTLSLNDKPFIQMQLGTGISKNPYFTFQLSGAKLGDTVKLVWSDNRGNTGQGEIAVTT